MAKAKSPREYPPIYEKVFPVVLGFLGIVIVTLLVITVAVALRLIGAG
ncbi:MAG: hypothetical protein PVJ21_15405 [Anaerolineales bacterium]|jgi:hypothetical protein